MDYNGQFSSQYLKYLRLLAHEFPTRQATFTEIINLQAIQNLPKGTEHFMSDLHGEYEAFNHILNNCSGVIREKVELLFADKLSEYDQENLCTLVYYPKEKLELVAEHHANTSEWYRSKINQLIDLAKFLTSKYTRSKVRKAIPVGYTFIIDELLHAQRDEDNNRALYHARIIDSVIETDSADDMIVAISSLIKRLAVDHLHIVGDVFDRGGHADLIMDRLMEYHSLDIQWGNHDVLWMGAAAGSEACILNAIRNNIRYDNWDILENGYGISLRPLALWAENTYKSGGKNSPIVKAVNVMMFKLEGQLIKRHPEYEMEGRLLLHKIDLQNGTIELDGKSYKLNTTDFPTLDPKDPYALSEDEARLMAGLKESFLNSHRLQRHIRFMYVKGSMYTRFNENLLLHGCVPLDKDGNFAQISMSPNGESYHGKGYLDFCERMARHAYLQHDPDGIDFMWYLWCGFRSPVSGRLMKTFERSYIDDESTWEEPEDPYFEFYKTEKTVMMILHEFDLYSDRSHIINGHTPVKVRKGEKAVRSNGKLLVIDGGFCRAYQKKTGIAGYTLIFNSHGLRLKAHRPFESVEKVLQENADITSETETVETERKRVMVADTDDGRVIATSIRDLNALLFAYRNGILQERHPDIKQR